MRVQQHHFYDNLSDTFPREINQQYSPNTAPDSHGPEAVQMTSSTWK